MFNRRNFLKTALTTGAIVALNPLNLVAENEAPKSQNEKIVAPKNKPLEWKQTFDILPPIKEPILLFSNSPNTYKKYWWINLKRLPEKPENIDLLWSSEFAISATDAQNPNLREALYKNTLLTPPQINPIGNATKLHHHLLFPFCQWLSLRELLHAPTSKDLSLLKPGVQAIIVKKAMIRRDFSRTTTWTNVLKLQPVSLTRKPKEQVDGRTYAMGDMGWFKNFYVKVDGDRSWIILPPLG